MRLCLDTKDDMGACIDWIWCCILLHNMLAQLGDAWNEEFAEEIGRILGVQDLHLNVNADIDHDDVGY